MSLLSSPRKDSGVKPSPLQLDSAHARFTFDELKRAERQNALQARRSTILMDESSFGAENYQPEYWLRVKLEESGTEESLPALLRTIEAHRDKSQGDLRKAVYKAHGDFLDISKEIMAFEEKLEQLKMTKEQLENAAHTILKFAGVETSVSTEEDELAEQGSKQAPVPIDEEQHRPAVADYEARKSKMLALAENISDFSKYVVEDRYLIFEGGGLTERVGTSTPKQLTLYLFNDALAMVVKKSRLALSTSTKRLTVERFWPLAETSISDVADSKSITNAFKVSRGGEHILLQAETVHGKRLWLQQISKSIEALQAEPSLSIARSPVPALRSSARGSPRPSGASHKRHPFGDALPMTKKTNEQAEISPERIDSLMSLLDRLNGDIACCAYETAAEMVDKIKFELGQPDPRLPAVHQLKNRLDAHIAKLTGYLYHEITDLIISKEEMARFIQLLVLLGFADEAKEKFLAARSDFIKESLKYWTIFFIDVISIDNLDI